MTDYYETVIKTIAKEDSSNNVFLGLEDKNSETNKNNNNEEYKKPSFGFNIFSNDLTKKESSNETNKNSSKRTPKGSSKNSERF